MCRRDIQNSRMDVAFARSAEFHTARRTPPHKQYSARFFFFGLTLAQRFERGNATVPGAKHLGADMVNTGAFMSQTFTSLIGGCAPSAYYTGTVVSADHGSFSRVRWKPFVGDAASPSCALCRIAPRLCRGRVVPDVAQHQGGCTLASASAHNTHRGVIEEGARLPLSRLPWQKHHRLAPVKIFHSATDLRGDAKSDNLSGWLL
jgi:hypothetical protein